MVIYFPTSPNYCFCLNEHNTVFTRSGPLYATSVSMGPPESSMQTASWSIQLFLQSSLDDRATDSDRPTDYATRSVTIGGAHNGEAKFCYRVRLQQVFIGEVDSTDGIMQFQQSEAIFSCKTRRVAVYVETHCNIASKRAFPTGIPDRWHNGLLIYSRTSCLKFWHSTIPSVACLRLSDASVICRVTYFQFLIQSAFLCIDPVSRYYGRDLTTQSGHSMYVRHAVS